MKLLFAAATRASRHASCWVWQHSYQSLKTESNFTAILLQVFYIHFCEVTFAAAARVSRLTSSVWCSQFFSLICRLIHATLNGTPLNDTLRVNIRVYREDLTEWRFVRSRFTPSIVLKMIENVGLAAVCQSFNQHVLRTLTPRKITLFRCGSFIFITD